MLKPPNGKSRQNVRRSVNDKVWDEVWDEVLLLLSMPFRPTNPEAPFSNVVYLRSFWNCVRSNRSVWLAR